MGLEQWGWWSGVVGDRAMRSLEDVGSPPVEEDSPSPRLQLLAVGWGGLVLAGCRSVTALGLV